MAFLGPSSESGRSSPKGMAMAPGQGQQPSAQQPSAQQLSVQQLSVQECADELGLGGLLGNYRNVSRGGYALSASLWIFGIFMLFSLLILQASPARFSIGALVVLIVVVACAVLLAWRRVMLRRGHERLFLYAGGVVTTTLSGRVAAAESWEGISGLFWRTRAGRRSRYRLLSIVHMLRLQRGDGLPVIKLQAETSPDRRPAQFVELANRYMAVALPRALARVAAGETQSFGQLVAGPAGLTAAGVTYPWAEIEGCRNVHGGLQIPMEQGRVTISVSPNRTPDVPIVERVVRAYLETKPAAPSS
jgi:hypothetical protein